MCVNEEILKKIKDCSIYYGLDYYEVPAGVLFSNGCECWLIKIKKGNVRKLYHQNHGRTGKIKQLPCAIEKVDNDIIHSYFHNQEWYETDIKKTIVYMYNHGKARRGYMDKQRPILSLFSVTNVNRGVAYGY